MHHISRLSAIRKASRWSNSGIDWHFHLLSPVCLLNPTKWHELFIESTKGAFVAKSHRDLSKNAHYLFHAQFKSQSKEVTSPHSAAFSKILNRAKHLGKKGIRWHYHFLPSRCIFNKHLGKWAIILEDPLNNKIIEVVYPHYPMQDLSKIETLFYSHRNWPR